MSGSSSDALNSGEKWVPHIIAANRTQVTTGKRHDPHRPASGGPAGSPGCRRRGGDARRSSVIGAPSAISGAATSVSSTCWTMWTENRVVS